MASLNRITMNIADWLLFSQVLVHCVFSEEEKAWLEKITTCIDHEVAKSGKTGRDAEILKHYIYCLLEIFSTEATPYPLNPPPEFPSKEECDRIHEFQQTWFGALTLAFGEAFGNIKKDEAFDMATRSASVMNRAPVTVRHRLVERLLAYEYPDVLLQLLTWFQRMEVTPVASMSMTHSQELDERAIARVGLLCSFEQSRYFSDRQKKSEPYAARFLDSGLKDLPEEAKGYFLEVKQRHEKLSFKRATGGSQEFLIARMHDKDFVQLFLKKIGLRWEWMQIHPGTQRKWPGIIGAFYVEKERLLHPQKPVYSGYRRHYEHTDDKPTICSDISQRLSAEFGLSISPKTLNERHTEFLEYGPKVALFYYRVLKGGGLTLRADSPDPVIYTAIAKGIAKPAVELLV